MLGPGTFIALAVAVFISVLGFSEPKHNLPPVSKLPTPAHPLFKPEPALLLANARLQLSGSQRRRIEAIEQQWVARRAENLTAMSSFQPKRGSLEQIKNGLTNYSALSRRYDATRVTYWGLATGVLSADQRARLPGGEQ